jgi:hypothetical protein
MQLAQLDPSFLFGLPEKILSADAIDKIEVAIASAVAVAIWNSYRKRRRLRSALKIEVTLTSDMHARTYTQDTRRFLEEAIKRDANYRVTIFSSGEHVVIGNLTDDISYIDPYVARRIIMFDARSRLIDDVVAYMRTEDFTSLPYTKKLAIVRIPFDLQDELQGLAMQLKAEL